MQVKRNRWWWTFMLQTVLGIMAIGLPSLTHANGLIPGTNPVFSGQELEVKNTVTVNGQTVVEGKTSPDAVITIDGLRDTVAQTLPALEPPSFPVNSSNTDATDAASPFVSDAEVFYKQITIREGNAATFSGGGPFHIKELKLEKDATVHLDQGVYFINALKMDNERTELVVTSEPVILHIGKEVKGAGPDVQINSGGTVAGLRMYLHEDAEFKGGKDLIVTGLLYGPDAKKVELKEDVTFRGTIIINGEIKLEKNIAITYTAADQAAVSAIDTGDTGGDTNTPPNADAGLDQAVQVGDTVIQFEAPATVIAPAGIPHQLRNTGDVPTDQIVVVGVGSKIYGPDGKLMQLPWRK